MRNSPHVVERELGKSGHLFFPAVGCPCCCLLLPIIASPNSSCIFRPGDVRVGRSPATWRGDRPLSSPPETYLPSRREWTLPRNLFPPLAGREGGQDLAYFRTRVSYKIFCAKADAMMGNRNRLSRKVNLAESSLLCSEIAIRDL